MILRAALLALILAAGPASAQGYDDAGLSESQTDRVVTLMREIFRECRAIDPVFRVDCLRHAYRTGARRMTNNAAYWEADVALTRVSRRLQSFQRAHRHPEGRRVRVDGERFDALDPAALATARALYRGLLAEARYNLGRGSTAQKEYFSPISELIAGTADMLDP